MFVLLDSWTFFILNTRFHCRWRHYWVIIWMVSRSVIDRTTRVNSGKCDTIFKHMSYHFIKMYRYRRCGVRNGREFFGPPKYLHLANDYSDADPTTNKNVVRTRSWAAPPVTRDCEIIPRKRFAIAVFRTRAINSPNVSDTVRDSKIQIKRCRSQK